MGNVHEVTDGTFKTEVLDSKVPVLVDFWAPWCGPCRAIAPIVEELATELGPKVKILKMNVDDNSQVPSQFGIRSIPTLKVFVGGSEVNQMVGSASKEQIKSFLTAHTK
ncbi:MAG: thioredoxin [Deltaproteobacteria bacterium]|nr:thioredoxin [Deltaproteobacteria bacterium]